MVLVDNFIHIVDVYTGRGCRDFTENLLLVYILGYIMTTSTRELWFYWSNLTSVSGKKNDMSLPGVVK